MNQKVARTIYRTYKAINRAREAVEKEIELLNKHDYPNLHDELLCICNHLDQSFVGFHELIDEALKTLNKK